ncbi:hypothetical protein D3C75_1224620 [compost metagenome]
MEFFILVLQIASEQLCIQCVSFGANLHTFAVVAQFIAADHVNGATGLMSQVGELQVIDIGRLNRDIDRCRQGF